MLNKSTHPLAMPRKTQTPQSILANRQSQQRSRARKADLVASLRAQVAAHERAGVAATLEMQRAARSVMQENERLRAFLASSVPPGLRCGNCGWRVVAGGGGGGETEAELEVAEVLRGLLEAGGGRTGGDGACARGEGVEECERVLGSGCCPPPLASSVGGYGGGGGSVEAGSPAQATGGSALEMSCEAAVDILTELQRGRGEVDAVQVRASLGCDGERDCRVPNTRLFDMMDEIS
ncbi:hypothetical protein QBC39DRAFT_408538 [Podospora conica]|nr:hypothetical protein QBC39DRAFT_408538 [Schizothecium conicum]